MHVFIARVATLLVLWHLLCALWVGFLLEQENVGIANLIICVDSVTLVCLCSLSNVLTADGVCFCCIGTLGILCEINVDDCVPGACHNNGTCIDRVGGFECHCPPGFVGPRCEGDINECLSNPCSSQGTLDCVQLVNNYVCNCKRGFMGHHCEMKVNFCDSSPCQNGGMCNAHEAGHSCVCRKGYYGKNCEFSGSDCDSNPCQYGGACVLVDGGGYRCDCPAGTAGKFCELDARNECASNPCKSGALCQDRLGDYACHCPDSWGGKNCDIYNPSFRAGWGHPVVPKPSRITTNTISAIDSDLEEQRAKCAANGCREKSGNLQCDQECNSYACNFDGNDCSLGINPWHNCSAPISCWKVFMDGKCDMECNNPQCLFDGRDCEKRLSECK